MKGIFLISQHNLGVGDYVQINNISSALSKNPELKIWHFSGGVSLNITAVKEVELKQLPIISRIHPNSGALRAYNEEDISITHKKRAEQLLYFFEQAQPAIIITGFFPFSKHRLGETLLPLLKNIKRNFPGVLIYSSIRDIPVSDHGPYLKDSFTDVNNILKSFYDGLLHHTDSRVISRSEIPYLKESLKGIKVFETGFVTSIQERPKIETEFLYDYLITVGGGWDGKIIIEKCCTDILADEPEARIIIICGPRMPSSDLSSINMSFQNSTIFESVNDLDSYMINSRIIISMAGYSTVPEILRLKKPCILIPRAGSFEQTVRARAFEKAGYIIFHDIKTDGSILNSIKKLSRLTPKFEINLDGAENTAKIFEDLLSK